ncbi:hypothetical protein SKAU_G00145720 [Synaphobranchus kaupii]|uniref:Uncharacterized protein n=1 Tax=Synaphobranchus kaupii TaxID=118154 RepID=A0A9Q1FT16_SYNKA|nr:hypothetical protein SKAU_G00145720 [Synaphobranchus kaupii]
MSTRIIPRNIPRDRLTASYRRVSIGFAFGSAIHDTKRQTALCPGPIPEHTKEGWKSPMRDSFCGALTHAADDDGASWAAARAELHLQGKCGLFFGRLALPTRARSRREPARGVIASERNKSNGRQSSFPGNYYIKADTTVLEEACHSAHPFSPLSRAGVEIFHFVLTEYFAVTVEQEGQPKRQ